MEKKQKEEALKAERKKQKEEKQKLKVEKQRLKEANKTAKKPRNKKTTSGMLNFSSIKLYSIYYVTV